MTMSKLLFFDCQFILCNLTIYAHKYYQVKTNNVSTPRGIITKILITLYCLFSISL